MHMENIKKLYGEPGEATHRIICCVIRTILNKGAYIIHEVDTNQTFVPLDAIETLHNKQPSCN